MRSWFVGSTETMLGVDPTIVCKWTLSTSAMGRARVKTAKQLSFRSIGSGGRVKHFVEGEDRRQGTLLPEYLEDYL